MNPRSSSLSGADPAAGEERDRRIHRRQGESPRIAPVPGRRLPTRSSRSTSRWPSSSCCCSAGLSTAVAGIEHCGPPRATRRRKVTGNGCGLGSSPWLLRSTRGGERQSGTVRPTCSLGGHHSRCGDALSPDPDAGRKGPRAQGTSSCSQARGRSAREGG